ncbi:MAG: peptidoglycan-binding domain-containing protein [Verrucomicrobiota bacterium]
MKNTTILTSALAISLALFQPVSAHAAAYAKKDDEQKGKEKSHGGGGKAGNKAQASEQPRIAAPAGHSKGSAARSANVSVAPGNSGAGHSRGARSAPVQSFAVPDAGVTARSSRYSPSASVVSQRSGYSARGGNVQPYANQGDYTRDNHYGGLWVLGDNHRDWDRNGVHVWNNHRYGWYDGGWLIIDGSFRPRGFTYSDYSSDSTVARVQRKLTARGYSLGSADGVIGPATRNAIAQYQQDKGLAVTGRINDPLQASLGME